MNTLLAIAFLGILVFFMAIGLIFAKKILKRGCSLSPDDCACLKEGKDPAKCDKEEST